MAPLVLQTRCDISGLLHGDAAGDSDGRLLVIAGPPVVHDAKATMEYAVGRPLRTSHSDALAFDRPRTRPPSHSTALTLDRPHTLPPPSRSSASPRRAAAFRLLTPPPHLPAHPASSSSPRYASRLVGLATELADDLLIVMNVSFEDSSSIPTGGWKVTARECHLDGRHHPPRPADW